MRDHEPNTATPVASVAATRALPARMGLMLDIETLGTKPGCVILSIGAIAYDMATMQPYECFTQNINVMVQMVSSGAAVDAGTLEFWRGQPEEVLIACASDAELPSVVFKNFVNWAGGFHYTEVVTRGTDFDLPILRHALEVYGLKLPWHYRTPRDLRTILSTLGFDEGAVPKDDSVAHTALGDCYWQLKVLAAARKERRVVHTSAFVEGQ